MKIYKIQRTTDGLFSLGGNAPKFNKNGKIWKKIGDIKSHLNQGIFYNSYNEGFYDNYKDCQLIEYEIVEREKVNIISILDEQKEKYILQQKKLKKTALENKRIRLKNKQNEIEKELKELELVSESE